MTSLSFHEWILASIGQCFSSARRVQFTTDQKISLLKCPSSEERKSLLQPIEGTGHQEKDLYQQHQPVVASIARRDVVLLSPRNNQDGEEEAEKSYYTDHVVAVKEEMPETAVVEEQEEEFLDKNNNMEEKDSCVNELQKWLQVVLSSSDNKNIRSCERYAAHLQSHGGFTNLKDLRDCGENQLQEVLDSMDCDTFDHRLRLKKAWMSIIKAGHNSFRQQPEYYNYI